MSWFGSWSGSAQQVPGAPDGGFKPGELLEYHSASQGKWITAKVLALNPKGTYDLDCKPDVPPEKLRRLAKPAADEDAYQPGEVVEYFGATQQRWVSAKVLKANSNGTYDLDCKPNVATEKMRRVAPARTAAAYEVGDTIEYFAATLGKWIPAKVLKVNQDGTFDLDCKPNVQPEKMRRPATLPPDAAAGPTKGSYKVGDMVSYYSSSQGKWIPAKVLAVTAKGTYDLDCKPDVSADKIKPVEQPVGTGNFGSGPLAMGGADKATYQVGDFVEYFATTLNKYIPAKVLKVNDDGTYDLDCKPNVLPEKLRPRNKPLSTSSIGSAVYSVGDQVEYFGASQQRWIPAKVVAVNGTGTFDLDCKPDVPVSRIRCPSSNAGSDAASAVSGSDTLRHVSFGGDTRNGLFAPPSTIPRLSDATNDQTALGSVREPVQLLRVQRRGDRWHFEVCPEGAAVLERHGQRRLAVASTCGGMGSGKTTLVNKLLGQKGPTPARLRGSTEGLWLWGPADNDDDKEPLLAFLDCEGFGRAEDDGSRESHLMTLCALLSSVVLLNVQGTLNEDLFKSLARVSRFVDNIEERGNEAHRPTLLWVLRDLVEGLKDERGAPITPEDLLEKALHQTAEPDQAKSQVTREVRQGFLKFFRNWTCLSLTKPSEQRGSPDSMSDKELSPNFRSGVEHVRQKILDACHASPKTVGGQPLGCFAFVQLLRQLVQALNEDRILNMRGAWEAVQHTVCGQLADDLRQSATTMLRALASGQQVPGGAKLPLTDEALYAVLRDQRHTLKSKWEEQAVGSEAVRREYWQELKDTLSREEALVRVQNGRMADQRLLEVLRSWQEWLDDDEGRNATSSDQICTLLGSTMDKLPALALSRANRQALTAVARRVASAHSTVAVTKAQHQDLQQKALAWGEQAAQQEGAARSQLEATRSQLQEQQGEKQKAEDALREVEAELDQKSGELEDAKVQLRQALEEIEAAQAREHDLKAHQRTVADSQAMMRSELDQCLATVAKMDAERLAGERCARTAVQSAQSDKERMEAELEEARAESTLLRQKIEQERECLKGENEKTRTEHQQRVEDVRRQLEEERNLLKGEQEKMWGEHRKQVEDARRQLEEERKVHSGTLVEHKGRLMERERGAGILEGKMQVLTTENATLRSQLQELEAKVRESEVLLANQAQENNRWRTDLTKARADAEQVEEDASQKLRTQAKELEQWLQDELDREDKAKPRCGCSIM